MLPTKDKNPENVVNPNFQKFLDKFHSIIEEPRFDKSKLLIELKKDAMLAHLTDHQRSAIVARCDNYINGTYGSTSKIRTVK